MESSAREPMKGKIVVNKFMIGGKEVNKLGRGYHSKKKKVVMTIELTV